MIDAATATTEEAPASAPTFLEMTQDVFETNKANGWFDEDRAFGDDLALIHSEISEMFEAFRDWGLEDKTEFFAGPAGHPKPQGVGSEAADVLVRILDTCHRSEVRLKWVALADVPPHPGYTPDTTFGSQITSMHLLTSYVSRESINLGPLVQYLVAFCAEHDLDLQAEFDRKLAYNKTRGFRHGGKRV